MENVLPSKELNINGQIYILKSDINKNSDVRIVILQRGWIYIGRFSKIENQCKLKNAYCIRVWGTTKGLQELVNGATNSTKLDKCEGDIEFDWLTVIHTISVKEDKWKEI